MFITTYIIARKRHDGSTWYHTGGTGWTKDISKARRFHSFAEAEEEQHRDRGDRIIRWASWDEGKKQQALHERRGAAQLRNE